MTNPHDSTEKSESNEKSIERFRRYVFGEDIFISYSRDDAPTYAAGLANELAARKFSCKFDQWGTQPGRELPEPLKKALRRSAMLVLISGRAATKSNSVRLEVEEFLKTGRTIVPIDLDGTIKTATWWGLIDGLPVSSETQDHIKSGDPSDEIVNRIDKTFNFNRKDQRLRKASMIVTGLIILLLAAGVVAGTYAGVKGRQATQELNRAKQASEEADRQTIVAVDAKEEAKKQTQAAVDAKADALEQTRIAGEQTIIAQTQKREATHAKAEADKQTKIAGRARVMADEAIEQQRVAEAQTRESVAQSMIATGDALLETKPEVAINLAFKAAHLSDTLDAVRLLHAGVNRMPLWFELVPAWSRPNALFIYTAFSLTNHDAIAASKKMDHVLSAGKLSGDNSPTELGLYRVPDNALISKIELQSGDKVITPDPLATSLLAVERKSKGVNVFDIYSLDAGKIEQPILEVRDATSVKFTDGGWPVYVVGKGGEISIYALSQDSKRVKRSEIGRWPEMIDLAVYPSKEQPTLGVIEPSAVRFVNLLDGGISSSKVVKLPGSRKSRESEKPEATWGPDPAKLILHFELGHTFADEVVYAIDAEAGLVQQIYEDKDGRFSTFFRTARNGHRIVIAGTSRKVGADSIVIVDIDWEHRDSSGGIRTTQRSGAWFEHGARSANTQSSVEDVIISSNGNFLVANRSGQGTSGLTSSDSVLEFWDIRVLEEKKTDLAPTVNNFHTNGAPVKRLAFSSDASRLLAWDAKGVVSIFRVNASATGSNDSGRIAPDVRARLSPKIEPAGDYGRFRKVVYADNDWRYFDLITGEETKLNEVVDQPIKDSLITNAGRTLTIATATQLLRYENRQVHKRLSLSEPVLAAVVNSEVTLVQTAGELKAFDTNSLQPLHSISLAGISKPGWIWGKRDTQNNVWIHAATRQDEISIHSWQFNAQAAEAGGKQLSHSKVNVEGLKETGHFEYLLGNDVLVIQTVPQNAYTDTPFGRFYDVGAKTEIRLYDLSTGKESQLLPPDKGWPTGAGSMSKLYLHGTEVVLVLKYRELDREEEFTVATWSRSGGACKSAVSLGISGDIVLSSYTGGSDIAHLLITRGDELILLRINDGKVLWRDKKSPIPELFPPVVFDSRSRSWSATTNGTYSKTVQRILMGDGANAFTHTQLPGLISDRYSRWLPAH